MASRKSAKSPNFSELICKVFPDEVPRIEFRGTSECHSRNSYVYEISEVANETLHEYRFELRSKCFSEDLYMSYTPAK